jgi:hypothetical protein
VKLTFVLLEIKKKVQHQLDEPESLPFSFHPPHWRGVICEFNKLVAVRDHMNSILPSLKLVFDLMVSRFLVTEAGRAPQPWRAQG